MKKMLSCVILSAILTAQLSSLTANAEETSPRTFGEYMAMSDSEFLICVGEYTHSGMASLTECGFGDSSVDDAVKFGKYLNVKPDWVISDNWESAQYHCWKSYISGETEPYIQLSTGSDPLDRSAAASGFGFPDDWEITYFEGRFVISDELSIPVCEYRITVPTEIMEDFESFVRLDKAVSDSRIFGEKYGVKAVDLFSRSKVIGEGELVPDAPLMGDANCDGKVTAADAAAVLQYLGNSDKYKLTAQGKANADLDENGLTTGDAVEIQKLVLDRNK